MSHSDQQSGIPWRASIFAIIFGIGVVWLSGYGVDYLRTGTSLLGYIKIPPAAIIGAASEAIRPQKSSDPEKITIMVGGDVMLDRSVRRIGEQFGYDSLFDEVRPVLERADIALVNLEGPITSNPSKTLLANAQTSRELTFTFATSTAGALKRAAIDLVSLANNHTDNFGVAGYEETKKRLGAAGVDWFGNPWNSGGTDRRECVKDVCVVFIGYHEFHSGYDKVLRSVKDHATSTDLIFVMPHWGDEYASTTPPRLRKKAAELSSAGADIIVGSHPHVVDGFEVMGRTPVFYSLGNFLFDQYFSTKTMNGAMLEIEVTKDSAGLKPRVTKIIQHDVVSAARDGGSEITGNKVIYENK